MKFTAQDHPYLLPYGVFIVAMSLLMVLPGEFWRLLYIYGLSTLFVTMNSSKDNTLVLVAMVHGGIHHLWPFMTPEGYNHAWSPFYDVVCHLIMLLLCFIRIRRHHKVYPFGNKKYENLFYILSWLFITGSVVNCFIAPYSMIPDSWEFRLFGLTAIFQAISTGYWVSTCLWNNNWEHKDFYRHWSVWIAVMSLNWFMYQMSDDLIGMSMEFRYVEALFIVASWLSYLR